MKAIVSIFKHVIAPVSFALAALVGLMAAAVSALVEYTVLQQWLRPEGLRMTYLPLAVVIALEGTKLFLHFSEAAFSQNRLSDSDQSLVKKYRDLLSLLKWSLVLFSLICTIIFTSSSFYYKVLGEQPPAMRQAQAGIDAEYDARLQDSADYAEQVYQEALKAAEIPVNQAQAHFDSIVIVYTPLREYQRTTAEKEKARIALEGAQEKYKQAQAAASSERTLYIESARTSLNAWRDEELEKLEKSALAAVAGDNQYLSSFLLFFSETFFDRTYTRVTYLIWVLFIALALSALLEGVISVSQYVLTLPSSVYEAISEGSGISKDERGKLLSVVKLILSAVVSFSLFIVYGSFCEITYTSVHLGAALVCCLLTALIPSTVFTMTWRPNAGWKKHLADAISEARSILIKGLLSFAGFFLIGLLFGESFATLSLPAIGISIGNAAGHLLHLQSTKDNAVAA